MSWHSMLHAAPIFRPHPMWVNGSPSYIHQYVFDQHHTRPGRCLALERKWDKRIAAIPKPWPSFNQACGYGGYCFNKNVPPYVWY